MSGKSIGQDIFEQYTKSRSGRSCGEDLHTGGLHDREGGGVQTGSTARGH